MIYRLQLADLHNLKLARTKETMPEIEELVRKSVQLALAS